MLLREVKELIGYHYKRGKQLAEHDCLNVFRKAVRDLRSQGWDFFQGKRILDLGCGQRFSFALQCAASGADVTALDLDYVKPDFLSLSFLRTLKHNGLKRSLKTLLRKCLFDKQYYDVLEKASGMPLFDYRYHINFAVADPLAARYPLPSESFELVVSNAVIEHVKDLPLFAAEINRLLRVRGLFYGIIHNFYSLSGGHNLEWAFPNEHPSVTVPPWDHLRDNRFPSHVYCNRLKPYEYLETFSGQLEVIHFEARDVTHDAGDYEGEKFLSTEIRKELSQYSRELLLTRCYCIILRKNQL